MNDSHNADLIGIANEDQALNNKLIDIWKNILEVDTVGIDDNFFELGGHSIKAIALEWELQKEFDVEILIEDIIRVLTIRKLTELIKNANKGGGIKITPAEAMDYYPLSWAQRGVFITSESRDCGTGFNLPYICRINGLLDVGRLTDVLKQIVQRHEAFRTSFEIRDEKPVQIIHANVSFEVDYLEIKEADIENTIKRFIRPFNLRKPPLFRAAIVKISELKYYIMLDAHHIISDGTSIKILLKEITSLYDGGLLEELPIQYKDYSVWENALADTEYLKARESFWQNTFADGIPIIKLPYDFPKPKDNEYIGDSISFDISEDIISKLKKLSVDNSVTMHALIFAVYSVLLQKYSGQNDIVIGSISAGRSFTELQNIIGMFINILPIRVKSDINVSFTELCEIVQQTLLDSYENQNYNFDKILNSVTHDKKYSTSPLFDTMLVFHSEFDKGVDFSTNSIKFEFHELNKNDSALDIQLDFYMNSLNNLSCTFEYNSSLFKKPTIEKMIQHFINIITEVSDNPTMKLNQINIMSKDEINEILYTLNDTEGYYDSSITFHQLFERQVEKSPHNIALILNDKVITYAQLNQKANQLARLLRDKGVSKECIVGIMVERSFEMIIGILAVLKAGGAYLPIDSNYPPDRIRYMLDDSCASILLTQSSFMDKAPQVQNIINIEDSNVYNGDNSNLENINDPSDLIYIIYTSGTTGRPKGVMIEHRNLINILYAWNKEYHLQDFEVRLLQIASFSFDVFAGDMARALANGGQMIICPESIKFDMSALYSLIKQKKVNIFESTPALIMPLMNYIYDNKLNIDCLKLLILGSDACQIEDYRGLLTKFGSTMRIINSYGITEATIDSSYYEEVIDNLPLLGITPIGKPLLNTQYYVLDSNLKPQPIGIYGELYIAGEGLARGYLNKPELTKQKYITNPFYKGRLMYKTGDVARWLPNGNIEFLGRLDYQLKIRGYRIELSEIESILLKYDNIREAVALGIEDLGGEKALAAYVIASTLLNIEELKSYLSSALPDYMVPTYIMQIDKMPLTSNGKIDRSQLPKPILKTSNDKELTLPTNEMEEKLSDIWKDVLKVNNLSINDNFFELGGNSIKAIMIITRIHKELNVNIPLGEIFKTPTIKIIADYISNSKRDIYMNMEKVDKQDYYAVTSTQKRVYALCNYEKDSIVYNMPVVVKIDKYIDKDLVESIFAQLVNRHEALRTSFKIMGDEVVQFVHDIVDFKVKYEELPEKRAKDIISDFIRPFDLNNPPLLRVLLIHTHANITILAIDMHHIISDGASLDIIVSEFFTLLNEGELSDIKIQYKDYAHWHNNLIESQHYLKQEAYWLNVFESKLPIAEIPLDYKRPAINSFNGDRVNNIIDSALYNKLKLLASNIDATLFMVLFSAYNVLLAIYTCSHDIIVGIPVSGRIHPDIENTVGMFVNTLAVRSYPAGNKTYRDFLAETKQNLIGAYENQDYQLDMLIDKLNIKRTSNRNILFDTLFSMRDLNGISASKKDFDLSECEYDFNISKFDLALYALEKEEEVYFQIEYSTDIFKKDTIERIGQHYLKLLQIIADNADIKLNEIELEQMIYDDTIIEEVEFNF